MKLELHMNKIKLLILLLSISTFVAADVNTAVDNFFSSITSGVDINSATTIMNNQSAGVMSLGGIATRSQVVNFNPVQFTPPTFNTSCGNLNFYSGSMSFMTNTDQLVQFMQNTLMTAGITAVMTALKAVTPNIAGTLQSMFDAAQKMLNMFNNSCQLGMALGNTAGSWVNDRVAKAKSQAHEDSADASEAEINSSTGGSSGSNLVDKMRKITEKYQNWVNKHAQLNPADNSDAASLMANKYGSVVWKGLQALNLYSLPYDSSDVKSIANLVISLTGDLIFYSPNDDGTGMQVRLIPPSINDISRFMTATNDKVQVYECTYFNNANPGECLDNTTKLDAIIYPTINYNGGIMLKIQKTMQNIQQHFITSTPLNNDDLMIIAISPMPIYAIAQALDDIGMTAEINSELQQYSGQISFELLQKLITVALNLSIQAATSRSNSDTQASISQFLNTVTNLQSQINAQSAKYITHDPVELLQKLNFLRSYAQDQMSPDIMQKVNFAKQLQNY